jgi:hypothetical protein
MVRSYIYYCPKYMVIKYNLNLSNTRCELMKSVQDLNQPLNSTTKDDILHMINQIPVPPLQPKQRISESNEKITSEPELPKSSSNLSNYIYSEEEGHEELYKKVLDSLLNDKRMMNASDVDIDRK